MIEDIGGWPIPVRSVTDAEVHEEGLVHQVRLLSPECPDLVHQVANLALFGPSGDLPTEHMFDRIECPWNGHLFSPTPPASLIPTLARLSPLPPSQAVSSASPGRPGRGSPGSG